MKIWLLSDYDSRKFAEFKKLLRKYAQIHPEQQFEFIVKSRKNMWLSFFDSLRDPKHKPLADIIEIPQNWTELFNRLGLLSEMSGYVSALREKNFGKYVLRELCRHSESGIYSVPWWQEAPALFYNVEIINGLVGSSEKDFLTWDAFLGVLQSVLDYSRHKNSKIIPLLLSGSSGAITVKDVLPRVWSRKGGLLFEESRRSAFLLNETVGGIEDWINLVRKGYIKLFSGLSYYDYDYSPAVNNAACVLSPRRLQKNKALNIFPYPGYFHGGGILIVNNLAVSSSSQEPESAAAFVDWLSLEENSLAFADSFNVFPCIKTAFISLMASDVKNEVFERVFSAPELMPNVMAYPTAEILMDRALWDISIKAARNDCTHEDIIKLLQLASGEADYLLDTSYGGLGG